jgi:hypothetical protein
VRTAQTHSLPHSITVRKWRGRLAKQKGGCCCQSDLVCHPYHLQWLLAVSVPPSLSHCSPSAKRATAASCFPGDLVALVEVTSTVTAHSEAQTGGASAAAGAVFSVDARATCVGTRVRAARSSQQSNTPAQHQVLGDHDCTVQLATAAASQPSAAAASRPHCTPPQHTRNCRAPQGRACATPGEHVLAAGGRGCIQPQGCRHRAMHTTQALRCR